MKPHNFVVTGAPGTSNLTATWEPAPHATSYKLRWRLAGKGFVSNNQLVVTSTKATFNVSAPGQWVARLEGCINSKCGPAVAARFRVEPSSQSNRAPTVNEGAEWYNNFVDSRSVPRGILVFKPFEGIFVDPDGDPLTVTVSVPVDHIGLVDSVYIAEVGDYVFLRMNADNDWGGITPALSHRLVTPVTLTATDPDGLSASITGNFLTHWDAEPESVEMPCSDGVIIGDPESNPLLVADFEALWTSRDVLDPDGAVLQNCGPATELAKWTGVSVSGTPKRVTSLWLYFTYDLTGWIPAELGNLTGLKTLYLDGNRLIGETPVSLGNLTNLTRLALDGNGLTGEIPSSLGNLTKLTEVHLNRNKLSGKVPASLGNLSKVWHLHLDNNLLSGEIPAEIGSLNSLGEFLWSANYLTGPIPDLSGLTKLTMLSLEDNRLTGPLPDLNDIPNLRSVTVSNNRLSGTIPDWSDHPALNELNLGGNSLTGCIADSLRDQIASQYSSTAPYGEVGAPFCADGTLVREPVENSPATGAPTVTGTARVGETLTADTTGISDDDGLVNATFSYQWLADDAGISGATGSSYTLADDDESKAVKVRVSFTDDAGNDETLTSTATAAVAAAATPVATGVAVTSTPASGGSANFANLNIIRSCNP